MKKCFVLCLFLLTSPLLHAKNSRITRSNKVKNAWIKVGGAVVALAAGGVIAWQSVKKSKAYQQKLQDVMPTIKKLAILHKKDERFGLSNKELILQGLLQEKLEAILLGITIDLNNPTAIPGMLTTKKNNANLVTAASISLILLGTFFLAWAGRDFAHLDTDNSQKKPNKPRARITVEGSFFTTKVTPPEMEALEKEEEPPQPIQVIHLIKPPPPPPRKKKPARKEFNPVPVPLSTRKQPKPDTPLEKKSSQELESDQNRYLRHSRYGGVL